MADITPEGSYPAVVNACALTEIESSHEERFNVEFRIAEGEHAGALVRASYGFSSDKATEFCISQLRALGWRGTDFANVGLDLSTTFSIRVKHNTNPKTGKTYAEATVNTGGLDRFALDANRAKAFAAKMAARVKAFDALNPTTPAAQKPAPTPRTNGAPQPPRALSPANGGWDGTGPEPGDNIPF